MCLINIRAMQSESISEEGSAGVSLKGVEVRGKTVPQPIYQR
jgi:tmRNA-binding protein